HPAARVYAQSSVGRHQANFGAQQGVDAGRAAACPSAAQLGGDQLARALQREAAWFRILSGDAAIRKSPRHAGRQPTFVQEPTDRDCLFLNTSRRLEINGRYGPCESLQKSPQALRRTEVKPTLGRNPLVASLPAAIGSARHVQYQRRKARE